MNIISNNTPRDLISFADLPADAQAEFDYVGTDERYVCRFARYKGNFYDVGDIACAPDSLPGWHGIQNESYFSGVLFHLLPNERVIVGAYFN